MRELRCFGGLAHTALPERGDFLTAEFLANCDEHDVRDFDLR